MIKRKLQNTILSSLKNFPVIGIIGSRQVGKTTLAKQIRNTIKKKSVYLDLELTSDLNKLQDAELFLSQKSDSLLIIDEIQRMPELFPLLRGLVDQNRISGRFLILGSASPGMIRKSSESLAGRIIYHELTPFSINEIGTEKKKLNELWVKGGYPESYLSKNYNLSFSWKQEFIKTFLERDIPQLGIRIPAAQLRKFWMMIAHNHGQLWNASQISNSLGVSAPTVKTYLDILEDTFVIRRLQPYYANVKKRLIKSPKVYIRDSGILHSLLNIKTMDELQGHPIVGSSWEGFVIEQIIDSISSYSEYFFYRSNAGAEIDLIIKQTSQNYLAIEVKYSLSPSLSRGFRNAFQDLKCDKGFVIYPGNEYYPLAKNVFALPVSQINKYF